MSIGLTYPSDVITVKVNDTANYQDQNMPENSTIYLVIMLILL